MKGRPIFKENLCGKALVIDKYEGKIRVGQKKASGSWEYGEWKDEQVLYITLARLLQWK